MMYFVRGTEPDSASPICDALTWSFSGTEDFVAARRHATRRVRLRPRPNRKDFRYVAPSPPMDEAARRPVAADRAPRDLVPLRGRRLEHRAERVDEPDDRRGRPDRK